MCFPGGSRPATMVCSRLISVRGTVLLIPPACPADRSVSRYTLRYCQPPHCGQSRRLARRIFRFIARETPDEPAGFASEGVRQVVTTRPLGRSKLLAASRAVCKLVVEIRDEWRTNSPIDRLGPIKTGRSFHVEPDGRADCRFHGKQAGPADAMKSRHAGRQRIGWANYTQPVPLRHQRSVRVVLAPYPTGST